MADFAHKAATADSTYLAAIEEYDLYCHYVAGLVGEGLSRLWSASGKEAGWLKYQLELSNSMGLLLQKTNIIRDYREDCDDQRFFWPMEIWGKYEFKEMKEMSEPGRAGIVGPERHDFGRPEACDGCAGLPPFIEEPERIQLLCYSCHYGHGYIGTVLHEQGYVPTEY